MSQEPYLIDLTAPDFGKVADSTFREKKLIALTGETILPPYNRSIVQIKEELYGAWQKFIELPDQEKVDVYSSEGLRGQRGFTPQDKEQLAETEVHSSWEYFMIGRDLEGTRERPHPLSIYNPSCYQPNLSMRENSLPKLGEEAIDRLELLVMETLEKIAQARGEWFGKYASKIAWGDHALRLHYFPKINPDDILREETCRELRTIDGRRAYNIPIIIQKNKGTPKKVTRTPPHPDVCFVHAFMDSGQTSMYTVDEQGHCQPFSIKPNQIIIKTGDFADKEIPEYTSSLHGVGISRENASVPQYLLSFYAHARPRCQIGDSNEAELLNKRLAEIGHQRPNNALRRIKELEKLPDDEQIVKELLKWENAHGIEKLRRYFRLGDNKEIYKRE